MASLRFGQRLRNFAGRDRFEQLWFLPLWIGLGLASLAIASLRFKQIAPRLGRHCGTIKPAIALTDVEEQRALQIRRTIAFAARYALWRADCYPQAIVARLMLGFYRLPFTISLGLRRDPESGQAQAHAWVECGKVFVSGGDSADGQSVVAVFASRVGNTRCPTRRL